MRALNHMLSTQEVTCPATESLQSHPRLFDQFGVAAAALRHGREFVDVRHGFGFV